MHCFCGVLFVVVVVVVILSGILGADFLVLEGGHDKARSVAACSAHSQPRMGKGQAPSHPTQLGTEQLAS